MKIKRVLMLVLAMGIGQLQVSGKDFNTVNTGIETIVFENDPADVIAKYIQAVGGKEKVAQIKNSVMEMEAEFQGANILIKGISDQENRRMVQETSVMGNVAQRMVVANGKGKVSAMGQEQELDENMLQMLKPQTFVFPEEHYEELGFELEFRGVEELDGEEANTLVITAPNGMKTMEYYSVSTGLKLKTSSDATGDITYSDYEEVDGVMIPMTLTIKNQMLPSAMVAKMVSIKFNQELSDEDFD